MAATVQSVSVEMILVISICVYTNTAGCNQTKMTESDMWDMKSSDLEENVWTPGKWLIRLHMGAKNISSSHQDRSRLILNFKNFVFTILKCMHSLGANDGIN